MYKKILIVVWKLIQFESWGKVLNSVEHQMYYIHEKRIPNI